MNNAQESALPVLHPVTDFEKIKRVGEGTYGVVCEAVIEANCFLCARCPATR